jgi:pimeloyl-ACP methyl ester carboxylesterase
MTNDFPPHTGAPGSRPTATLPTPVAGELLRLDRRAGAVGLHVAGADTGPPLLLVHSVNAAASVHEVAPLFEHFRSTRAVYAPDLPGYGQSNRSARAYTPRLMTDALHDTLDVIAHRHGDQPVDALAVSLGCEFLARAAVEAPQRFRSVALVSPTSFGRRAPRRGPPGAHLGMPWLHRAVTQPLWSQGLFDLLTSRASIRFFLRKTFGSRELDAELLEFSWRTAREPGARHAPLHFLSGFLFARDANDLYERLSMPVWMCHGTRGDFTDYAWKATLARRPGWRFTVYEGCGALPYFQQPEPFMHDFDTFLASLS